MEFVDLLPKIQTWMKDQVDLAVKNEELGRKWFTKAIEYISPLTLKDLKTFFSRETQNTEYVKRYKVENPNSKVPYTYLQAEMDMLFSLHKSFALKHKTRLGFYRDDLSQKGVHNYSAISLSFAKFKAMKNMAENGTGQ